MESNPQKHHHHHHILSTKTAVGVGATLLLLTVVTVAVAHVDLGRFNFFIAMVVATIKALFVVLIFMGLKYDHRENAMIFGASFLFLAIFMVLTSMDLFFRGSHHVEPMVAGNLNTSKLKTPWISTPELVEHGKSLFTVQCASCHGEAGKGNGPAAAALTPRPRDFTDTGHWKNGRKPTMVFKTLKEGLPPSAMASYATLPVDDRWALTHYVLSLAPSPLQDEAGDFSKAGLDPSKPGGGGSVEAPTIPIELAMERLAVSEPMPAPRVYHPQFVHLEKAEPASVGQKLYESSCIECHGVHGKGGVKVRNLGVYPTAFVTTRHFSQMEAARSEDAFADAVIHGLPGELMPAFGEWSQSEIHELYQYLKGVSSAGSI